jgi:hypothetical protein
MTTPNAQYNVARPDSFPVRTALHQRRKMFAAFLASVQPAEADTVLDIGATSDRSYEHSNYLEAWLPNPQRITAAGIDPGAIFLEDLYPGLHFVEADGRDLPFPDGSFEHVHSSAVLEHVGSRVDQARFLRECWRVARATVFITTPNRWFPIEFHTVLPLVHWLPPPLFRGMLRAMGKDFFAREENLNLLSRADLLRAARAAGMDHVSVENVALLGWPTNLLLIARKPAEAARVE